MDRVVIERGGRAFCGDVFERGGGGVRGGWVNGWGAMNIYIHGYIYTWYLDKRKCFFPSYLGEAEDGEQLAGGHDGLVAHVGRPL